ncbi:MAG: hypothetical protein ACSHW7_06790 [Patiriisocius sp.]
MKNILRTIIAAWGAKKIGGGRCGCVGTVIVFIIIFIVLGWLGLS